MPVLVAYASRYGATRGIAERIAAELAAAGHEAEALSVKAVDDLTGYEAFVIGSAVYFGRWRKEATEFVRRNHDVLADRPVWLFSSGPLGSALKDTQGRDLREVAAPKESAEFGETIRPRDHRVFFGVLDRSKLGLGHRLLASLPASRATWAIDGDFRDWQDIASWVETIAQEIISGPASRDVS